MTVSSQVASASFVANGTTTVFPCAFKVFDQAHVQVHVDGTLKTLTTDYTVSGVGNDSFDVTFLAAPADGAEVSVARVVPLLQATDYLENDEFPAETHERALDLLVMMIQQLAEGNTGKAVRFPASDPATLTGELPAALVRAGKLLAFDSAGEVVAATGASFGVLSVGSINTWTAKQTFQGGEIIELIHTPASSAHYGPVVRAYTVRGTINPGDLLARYDFEANDSGGVRQRFASINGAIHDVDGDDGQLDVAARIEGEMVNIFRFESSGLIPRAGAFWTDPGAGEGPYTSTYRKITPSAGQPIGAYVAVALDSLGDSKNFFKLLTRVDDPTVGSEDSHAEFFIYSAGVLTEIMSLRADGIHLDAKNVRILAGPGSPEGVRDAPKGSIFMRNDGGVGSTFYVKESGTGNTGWVAK